MIVEPVCVKRVNPVNKPDLIMSPSRSYLSHLSQSIIESFKTKNVIAVFAQGPLNITPLVSALHAALGQDVMVSLPSEGFNQTYKKYTQEFFSLLYTNSTDPFAYPQFFYTKILWGTAKIRDDDEPFADFDVEKEPIHGKGRFQKEYEKMMDRLLRSGELNLPKVVFVQTKDYLPAGAIGKKSIRFKKEEYSCLEFNPSLIILESINERRVNFEGLLAFSRAAVSQGRKVILHFSWPYLEDLDQFISGLERDHGDLFSSLHLGKRICLELARDMGPSPPPHAMAVSLEDGQWESGYYSSGESIGRIKMLVPASGQTESVRDLEALEDSIDALDEAQGAIFDNLGTLGQQEGFVIGLLVNPPIMDSVATPSESLINAYVEQMGTWRHIPLQNYVENVLGPYSSMARDFGRIAADLDKCRDLTAELKWLKTPNIPRKKTVFQFSVLYELARAVNAVCWENRQAEVSIVLSDYHPILATRKKVVKNIIDELAALKDLCKAPQLSISDADGTVKLSIGDLSMAIYEGGMLISPDREQLKLLSNKLQYPNAYLSVCPIGNQVKVEAGFEISCPILRAQPVSSSRMELSRKLYFPLFSTRVGVEGDYDIAKVKTVEIDDRGQNDEVTALLKIQHSGKSRLQTVPIHIYYQRPERIRKLPRETIERSTLVMPGPMPFFSIDDESVSMAKGYDCVLLPFKKVVFLAYPGRNSHIVRKQIERLADLYSEEQTPVSRHDLARSLALTRRTNHIQLPPQPRGNSSSSPSGGTTPLDDAIRTMQESSATSPNGKGVVSLKELWDRIESNSKRSNAGGGAANGSELMSKRDQVTWRVDFDGAVETLYFTHGIFIRVRDGDEYVLKTVEELAPGDQILYFDSIERESVDNFLLRDYFGDKSITLEQVLEPIKCLSLFYDSIRSIRVGELYESNMMKDLYWLNGKQKERLYRLIQIMQGDEYAMDEIEEIMEYGIWANHVTLQDLEEISNEGGPAISYKKLHMVALHMGLSLKQSTFTQLFILSRNDGSHWLFRDEKNLLAIAKLIGHDYLAEHYEEVNDMGRRVTVILTMVGRSISRVASGRGELTEMDQRIEGKLRKGTIVN